MSIFDDLLFEITRKEVFAFGNITRDWLFFETAGQVSRIDGESDGESLKQRTVPCSMFYTLTIKSWSNFFIGHLCEQLVGIFSYLNKLWESN
ncbi:MAG: hypothetical protein XD85_0261 [Parcubacteria bacterium 34_609]|nr:MAG: hypothetical protein XD85_0261 [Parcubacteria bacterium 34_609]